ncbi:amidohydrolase family protein [Actinoplanes sp. TBRC 11911]|uniref:amidohydrolase family protein n=1 Tax=Actinoplanes sp. TBRC 11911 TaxID=2729386 RepID=UPI00145F350D|nr:amidohydrolase family protein [Actinoplanes sp. TBRC 11911]NMO57014.1 amidohydrolase family protein [Actinoplanes sp. TBRC 11911]
MSRLNGERVLVRDAALADGRSSRLTLGVSLLVENGLVAGLWTDGDEPAAAQVRDVPVIDGSGATIVPGMVDSHAHLAFPGGGRWVERVLDPPEELVQVAEENGELLVRAGVRWARDVGAPRWHDPDVGADRALNLTLRDRWQGRADRPYLRAAGTWISRKGSMLPGLMIEVEHAADLVTAVNQQLDEGADLVKIYLDGPDPAAAPFSAAELRAAVEAAHERGAKVAAHGTLLAGNRVGAEAGIDSLEHGNELDLDTVRVMKRNGVTLVATMAVWKSRAGFAGTTRGDFSGPAAEKREAALRETVGASFRLAYAEGVTIAAGTDSGGGSPRANHLAWEVEALVEGGMRAEDALAAVTWRGGDLMGVPEAGRLVAGGPAHFSLVHGDPLSDPASLWRVWLTR